MRSLLALAVLLVAPPLLLACGESSSRRTVPDEPAHPLLADADEVRSDASAGDTPLTDAFDALERALEGEPTLTALEVVQPGEGEALLADERPVRFLWRDGTDGVDTWWIGVRFAKEGAADLRLLVPGAMPAEAALDPFSVGLHAWTPSPEVWSHWVMHGTGASVVVTLAGFAADAPDAPLSSGAVTVTLEAPR